MVSSSTTVYNMEYDVFISFRGSDIRQSFLSHLNKALLDAKINVFVDEKLERGKEISESLLEKIEESRIALVVFSQNYAYSEWCLEELVKIAECRYRIGQIVIPVFYGVDPSHVQDLTGSYGDAIAQHRTIFDESMVENWGNVLKNAAILSGFVSSNFKTESNLIEEIVKHILEKVPNKVQGLPLALKVRGSNLLDKCEEKLEKLEEKWEDVLNAFHKKAPNEGHLNPIKRAVEDAQDLPVALKVSGSNMLDECEGKLENLAKAWEEELEKLRSRSSYKKFQRYFRL